RVRAERCVAGSNPALSVFWRHVRCQTPDMSVSGVDTSTILRKMPSQSPFVELEVGPRTVKVTNPDKVFFRPRGETKLDLVGYYLIVGDGIVRALYERPT